MPVVPNIDGRTATFDEIAAFVKAAAENKAIRERNVAIAEAQIAAGMAAGPGTSFPWGHCPDCDETMPVRDDGTVECPNHGVLPS